MSWSLGQLGIMCTLKNGRDFVQTRSPLKGNKKGVREVQAPVSPACHPDTDEGLQGMAIGCLLYSIPVDTLSSASMYSTGAHWRLPKKSIYGSCSVMPPADLKCGCQGYCSKIGPIVLVMVEFVNHTIYSHVKETSSTPKVVVLLRYNWQMRIVDYIGLVRCLSQERC